MYHRSQLRRMVNETSNLKRPCVCVESSHLISDPSQNTFFIYIVASVPLCFRCGNSQFHRPKGDYSGNTPKLKQGNKDLLHVSIVSETECWISKPIDLASIRCENRCISGGFAWYCCGEWQWRGGSGTVGKRRSRRVNWLLFESGSGSIGRVVVAPSSILAMAATLSVSLAPLSYSYDEASTWTTIFSWLLFLGRQRATSWGDQLNKTQVLWFRCSLSLGFCVSES
jgi:hypothetical protein